MRERGLNTFLSYLQFEFAQLQSVSFFTRVKNFEVGNCEPLSVA